MRRLYESVIRQHLSENEQMAFLSGPRQVGKTTISKKISAESKRSKYLNWDILEDRATILNGLPSIVSGLKMDLLAPDKPLLVLDEVHKNKNWKNLLKGYFDATKGKLNILVTGSSKLNVFRRGGDSLMGRYFLYRMHPLSVAELKNDQTGEDLLRKPERPDPTQWEALFRFGGFPEPFSKSNVRFYNRWQNLRLEQLFKEDIRNLEQVQDIAQLELLAFQIRSYASKQLSYTSLANKVRISDPTVRRWIRILEQFYYCFTVTPYSQNIARSILKEPKIYLRDWSMVDDPGARVENFLACHLLKAVEFWNDAGLGSFSLHYVRDKEQREVDFLVVKDRIPWILIEAKKSASDSLNPALKSFQNQLKAKIAIQVAFDAEYIDQDVRTLSSPVIFPMQTFLSQLV